MNCLEKDNLEQKIKIKLYLESTSPAPFVESKSRKKFRPFFQKVLVNLRSDFFLIFLFPLLDMGLGNIFASGTCPRNLTWAGQNGHWNLKIARVSFIGRIHLRSRGIWKITLCLLFWDRKNTDFQPDAGRRSKKPFFAYMTQYMAIWHLFHPNLRSNCRFCVVIMLGIIKHPEYSRNKQRNSKERPYKAVLPLK